MMDLRLGARLVPATVLLGAVFFLVLSLGACVKAAPTATPTSTPQATLTPTPTLILGATPAPTSRPEPGPAIPQREPLDAPLPSLFPPPAGSQDEAAEALARQVLAGGEGALPALLTALQAAGFGVLGPDGKLTVQPAQPSQGLAFETWEVRAMAELAGAEQQVLVPIANFAEVLASPLAELKDAPLQQFILDGIRTHAGGNQPTLRFWARFIVELGRQAESHEPYDLLGQADTDKVSLDNVQTSLILRRLSGDLLALSGAAKTSTLPSTRPPGLGAVAYASSQPCAFGETESMILDTSALGVTTGFSQLMGYLEKKGMQAAAKIGSITGWANIVLTYARLGLVHAAFNIKIEMEGAPLVRPKERGPAAGEPKTVVATVKMDIGKGQWVNCFRSMLNTAGLDFNLPDDGPVKDAGVEWGGVEGFSEAAAVLHGGPEQIVRFSAGDITKKSTDKFGISRVVVEGVGQKEALPESVRQVRKQATVRANITLQKADIFKDLLAAGGTALGGVAGLLTVPAELIYRTNWTLGGRLTFDVIDWEGGPPELGGYITYRVEWPSKPDKWQWDAQVEIRFPGGQGEWIAGQGTWAAGQGPWTAGQGTWAAGQGTFTAQTVMGYTTDPAGYTCYNYYLESGSGSGTAVLVVVDPNNPPLTTLLGRPWWVSFTDQGAAVVIVTIMEDGSYSITAYAPVQMVKSRLASPACQGVADTVIPTAWSIDFDAKGNVDPKNVTEISGQKIFPTGSPDYAVVDPTSSTSTITWSIREE